MDKYIVEGVKPLSDPWNASPERRTVDGALAAVDRLRELGWKTSIKRVGAVELSSAVLNPDRVR